MKQQEARAASAAQAANKVCERNIWRAKYLASEIPKMNFRKIPIQ
jgi:hypothetical protein